MLKNFIKKWIFIFIIIVANLIIGLKVSVGFFHFFFYFLLSTIVLNFIWILVQYFGTSLSLKRKLVGQIIEDDSLEITALIKNKGFVPVFNLVLEDWSSCADPAERKKRFLLDYLGGGLSSVINYSYVCHNRGKYEIGPFCVYFFDFFGLFFLKRTYRLYSQLYVYPKTINIKKLPALSKGAVPWFGLVTSPSAGDDDEFYGLREYRAGDPIKKIHWISSARHNQLIIKQFQRQSFFKATLIFNLEKENNFGEGKETVLEYTVKLAASITKYLLDRGISLQVITHTTEAVHIPFNKGPEHLNDIFKFLATLKSESKVSLGELLEESSNHIPSGSNLIVIMLDREWKYFPTLLPLEKRDLTLMPLIMISSTFVSIFGDKEVIRGTKIQFSKMFNFTPLFISRGDNLEKTFLVF